MGKIARDFFANFPAVANVLPYPLIRVGLGKYQREPHEKPPSFKDRRPDDDVAATNVDNLLCFGFEAVKIKLDTANNPGLKLPNNTPLEVTVKVRHPVSMMYLVAHGTHNEGQIDLGTETLFPETVKFTEQDSSSLKTLVLDSCNVLDMHDYNNNYADHPNLDANRSSANDTIAQRVSPGQKWWLKTTKPHNTVLLGYSFPCLAPAALNATAHYLNELPRLQGQVPNERLQQLAWLSSHAKASEELERVYRQTLGACAWDQSGYYFISISNPLKQFSEPDPFKEVRKVQGYYRVPLDPSGENTLVRPGVPPAEGGVEELLIPQAP